MENTIEMDDLGVPLFQETSIWHFWGTTPRTPHGANVARRRRRGRHGGILPHGQVAVELIEALLAVVDCLMNCLLLARSRWVWKHHEALQNDK